MGAPKPQNVTQTNTVKLSPEQQQIFDMALPSIQGYAAQTPQLFPGSGIAGFNPFEVQGQQYATGVAAPQAQSLAQQAAGTQSQLLDPNFMLNPNQYLMAGMDAVTNKVTQNLNENILPGIRGTSTQAAGPGAFTTREGIAQGLAIDRTNQGLSAALSDMLLKNYTAGLGGLSTAIGQNPSVLQQQLFPANIYSAVGGQQRGLEQAQLDEQIRQFYAQQDLPLSKAQQLLSLISGMPGGSGVSTVTPAKPQTDMLSKILGNAMMAVGVMTGMPTMGTGTGMGTGTTMGK